MSDFVEELREECKIKRSQVDELWHWYQGNGELSARSRLSAQARLIDGKEDSAAMSQIKRHEEWHEKVLKDAEKHSGRRWELIVGIVLIIATQIVTLLTIH